MLSLLSTASGHDFWIILFCTVVVGYLAYCLVERRPQNLPPGPLGLPFVGYVPFIKFPPYRQFLELGKTYGHIMKINIFGADVIILNSYEAIKECFCTRGEQFSGRVGDMKILARHLFQGLGFFQEEGSTLQEYRHFSLHTLGNFAFGKPSMEGRIQEICEDLIGTLTKSHGKSCNLMDLLEMATVNVILYLTMDKKLKSDDPDFKLIRKNVEMMRKAFCGVDLFIPTFAARFLPKEWYPGYAAIAQAKEEIFGLFNGYIKEHEETFQASDLRNFIDAYLAKRTETLKEGNVYTVFTVERLKVILLNLLVAGTETTSNTIYWALRIISGRPEIQAKLHKELDEVVGRDRSPSILDRHNLPYTDGVILEVLRFTSVAPVGIPHSNPGAATLNEFHIPARSVILANLWGVHNDPGYWIEPEKFNPDRFMDPVTRAERRERVIPFSLGKRACIGESVARMEIFLFLTILLQKFRFRLQEVETTDLPECEGLMSIHQPCEIYAESRALLTSQAVTYVAR